MPLLTNTGGWATGKDHMPQFKRGCREQSKYAFNLMPPAAWTLKQLPAGPSTISVTSHRWRRSQTH